MIPLTFNPCKKCIVRPICRTRCERLQYRWDFGDTLITTFVRILLLGSALTIVTNGWSFLGR